ncbi:MAG: ribonuclease T2 family protein [Halocynthiibacter sp.]
MRAVFALILTLTAGVTAPVFADGERAGDFDYYVMSLSWSPTWCTLEGDARGARQCADDKDYGFILHGLWPQYDEGWPSYCRTPHRDPSRSDTNAMTDIMGTGGLAWHQWKKHGRCSGLSSDAYFALSRDAFAKINRPAVFRKLDKTYALPARVIEAAFLKDNPEFTKDMITITCRDHHIQEVRVCLTKDLEPTRCGRDTLRDCTLKDARMPPIHE